MKTFPLDPDLIAHAQTGDLDAFNQIVLQYQGGMYHYAVSLTHDPDLAEDITQESFIKAFQHIDAFRGGSLRAWLIKIVTNTVCDVARRNARHPTIPLYPKDEDGEDFDSAEWLIDPDQFVEAVVQRRETAARLYHALDQLPEFYRSVLTLIDLQDMDYTEAAEVLGVPLGTIKSRLARARMQMKTMLVAGNKHHTPLIGMKNRIAAPL